MLDWTQILSVINLQRQRGTAPQSRVSSRQHVSPGENTVYVCVCVCVCVTVYYHLCKYPQQTTLYYPTASVPAGQPAVICSAEGYECWHFTDMTCRSFLNYRNPKVPEDDDDGPPNQMPVYSWFHRCSEGIPPHYAGRLFRGTPPMNL